MTKEERETLSFAIAILAEAHGLPGAWRAADTCPQGHSNVDWNGIPKMPIGSRCEACETLWWNKQIERDASHETLSDRLEDPAFHPEWRIGRVPQDIMDPAILFPLLEAYLGQPNAVVTWEWQKGTKGWQVRGAIRIYGRDRIFNGIGATLPETLAQVLKSALEATFLSSLASQQGLTAEETARYEASLDTLFTPPRREFLLESAAKGAEHGNP